MNDPNFDLGKNDKEGSSKNLIKPFTSDLKEKSLHYHQRAKERNHTQGLSSRKVETKP